MDTPFSLFNTYIHLQEGTGAVPVPVGEDFWATIDQRTDLDAGRLVMAMHMTEDWDHWEMHPAGEEVLFLLWGDMDFILDTPVGEQQTRLTQGQALIVPRGVWHRALVLEPSNLLTITPGEGTQHRPL